MALKDAYRRQVRSSQASLSSLFPQQEGFIPTELGDPNFGLSTTPSSQAQFPAAAAEQRIHQNRTQADNVLQQAQAAGINTLLPQYDPIRQVAETGFKERALTIGEGLINFIDGGREAVNLVFQDLLGGPAAEGKKDPTIADYFDALWFGIKDQDGFTEATGLNPDSGSHTLDILGWSPSDNLGGKIARGVATFGFEMLTDPLTYVTFGLSGLGKNAAMAASRRFGDDVAGAIMPLVKDGTIHTAVDQITSPYARNLARNIDQVTEDFIHTHLRTLDEDRQQAIWRWLIRNVDESIDPTDTAAIYREAMDNATELAIYNRVRDDVMSPLLRRDFKNISREALQDLPAYAYGGARISIPFTEKMLRSGKIIPGTQGLGKKLVGDPIREMSAKLRKLTPYRKLANKLDEMADNIWADRSLLKGLARTEDGIEGWQYHILENSLDRLRNRHTLEVTKAQLNSRKERIVELARAAKPAHLDEDEWLGNVWGDVMARLEDRGATNLLVQNLLQPATANRLRLEGSLDEEVNGLARELRGIFDGYHAALGEFDESAVKRYIDGYAPHQVSTEVSSFLGELAGKGGTQDRKVIEGAQARGDLGGVIMAQLLNAIGKGGRLEDSIGATRYQNHRDLGRMAALTLTDLGAVLFDQDWLQGLKAGASDVLGEGGEVVKGAMTGQYLTVRELNDFLRPVMEELSSTYGVALPKNWDGRVFNDNPLDVAAAYIENLDEVVAQWGYVDALHSAGLAVRHGAAPDAQTMLQSIYANMIKQTRKIKEDMAPQLDDGTAPVGWLMRMLDPVDWEKASDRSAGMSAADLTAKYDLELESEAFPVMRESKPNQYGGFDLSERAGSWDEFVEDVRQNGIKRPINVGFDGQGNHIIIDGHNRLKAAMDAGLEDVPITLTRMDADVDEIASQHGVNLRNHINDDFLTQTTKAVEPEVDEGELMARREQRVLEQQVSKSDRMKKYGRTGDVSGAVISGEGKLGLVYRPGAEGSRPTSHADVARETFGTEVENEALMLMSLNEADDAARNMNIFVHDWDKINDAQRQEMFNFARHHGFERVDVMDAKYGHQTLDVPARGAEVPEQVVDDDAIFGPAPVTLPSGERARTVRGAILRDDGEVDLIGEFELFDPGETEMFGLYATHEDALTARGEEGFEYFDDVVQGGNRIVVGSMYKDSLYIIADWPRTSPEMKERLFAFARHHEAKNLNVTGPFQTSMAEPLRIGVPSKPMLKQAQPPARLPAAAAPEPKVTVASGGQRGLSPGDVYSSVPWGPRRTGPVKRVLRGFDAAAEASDKATATNLVDEVAATRLGATGIDDLARAATNATSPDLGESAQRGFADMADVTEDPTRRWMDAESEAWEPIGKHEPIEGSNLDRGTIAQTSEDGVEEITHIRIRDRSPRGMGPFDTPVTQGQLTLIRANGKLSTIRFHAPNAKIRNQMLEELIDVLPLNDEFVDAFVRTAKGEFGNLEMDRQTAEAVYEALLHKVDRLPDTVKEALSGQPAEVITFRAAYETFMQEINQFFKDYSTFYSDETGELFLGRADIAGTDAFMKRINGLRKAARELKEEHGFETATRIFQGIDEYVGLADRPGFVNPRMFALGGPALEDSVVQADMLRFTRQLARNSATIYTPEGVAALKLATNSVLTWWKAMATIARPGFHVRNLIGGVWNNMIAGVGPKDYLAVKTHAMAIRKKVLTERLDFDDAIRAVIKDPKEQATWIAAWENDVLSGFVSTEFRNLTGAQKKGRLSWANIFDIEQFGLTRVGGRFMESIEDFLRMSTFHAWYDPDNPATAKVARDMVKAIHFDYSNLTPFETKVKSFVPFFVWTKNNLALQTRQFAENPRMVQRYRAMMNSMDDQFEDSGYPDPENYSAFAFDTGYKVNGGTPFWARVMIDPDLPIRDFLELPNPTPPELLNYANELLGPHIGSLVDLNEQRDFGPVNAPAPINSVLKALAAVGLFDTTTDGDVRIPYWSRTMMELAMPFGRDVVEPAFGGPTDPNRQARAGIGQDAGALESIGKAFAAPLTRALGVQYSPPSDIRGAAGASNAALDALVEQLRLSGQLPAAPQEGGGSSALGALFPGG